MAVDKLKVLQLITRSDWGGAQRIVKLLATCTSHDTAVACGPGGKLIDELASVDIPVYTQPHLQSPPHPVSDLKAFFDILRLLRSASFDIIHCHSTKAGALGRLAATMTGTHSVFTVHGWGSYNTEYNWMAPVILSGERLLARSTNEIVCVSENDFEYGHHKGIIQHSNARVIHNGIPPNEPPSNRVTLHEELNIAKNRPIIGAIARLAPQKNPLAILRTAEQLQRRGHDFATVLIGDGPLMSKCEQYLQTHSLDDVYLLGFREQALKLLSDLDIFLMPSRFEGFPLTILESMQLGVPPIAYDVGGVAEVIEDEVSGFVVDAEDHDRFVDRVELLLNNPSRRKEMGARAKTQVETYYTSDRMVRDYENVYEDIMIRQESRENNV